MRQLNFDLKTLQARHRDGAFVTRRDRAYALAQARVRSAPPTNPGHQENAPLRSRAQEGREKRSPVIRKGSENARRHHPSFSFLWYELWYELYKLLI